MTVIPFGFDGAHGVDVRPGHVTATKPWARDESTPGAGDGTRITQSWANDVTANLIALITASGITVTEGQSDKLKLAIDAIIATAITARLVNTLGSTDATKALTAAQGKALKDLIDGLGDVI